MARRNRYYTNLDYVDEGLKRKNKESQAAMAPGMHMQVGSNQIRPSDMVRMASMAAPVIGGLAGAGIGGLGGWLAGGGGVTGLPTAGAGAMAGMGAGAGLGQAAGGMGAGWADQMEKEQEEEQARLAAQRAALMSLV